MASASSNKYLDMNIAGYTLVDITDTGIYRQNSDNSLERNQQRNWETVLQIIGLRIQPINIKPPRHPQIVPMSKHQFGSFYRGSQQCWKFAFYVETPSALGSHEHPIEFLEQDFDKIPIITGLSETISLPDSVFYTSGILKNIYFRISDQLD